MADPKLLDPKTDWPRARLLGSLHAMKIGEVSRAEDGTVSVMAEHNHTWYTLDAEWGKVNNPVAGGYLVHFSKGGQIASTDAAFVASNLSIAQT